MPGENLHKLTKSELKELRRVVRRVYFRDFPKQLQKERIDDKEVDKLIDSLLPDTVEKLREMGIQSGFVERKKLVGASPIVDASGQRIRR